MDIWILKNILGFKIELLYNPGIVLLSIYSKTRKTLIQRDIWTPMFIPALFIVAKLWKQPVSIDT